MEKFLKYLMLMLAATFSLTFISCGNDEKEPEIDSYDFNDGSPVPNDVRNNPEKYGFVDISCWSIDGYSDEYEYCFFNPESNLCFLNGKPTFVKLTYKLTGNIKVRISSNGSCIWHLEDSYYFKSDGYWQPEGIFYVVGDTEPRYVEYIIDDNNGGDTPGGGNTGGSEEDEWEAFDAPGIMPYWYCPTDGSKIPSNPSKTTYRAFHNKKTGAYKIKYAYDEYRVTKGYNKLIIDKEYHSVWVSSFGGYWKSCLDYYYLEVTI